MTMRTGLSDASPAAAPCPGCGIRLSPVEGATHDYVGASPACWELYSTVLAREYQDAAYMEVHRLTVDAYCAQHPGEPERRSIKSVNVHLVGLYLVLERESDGAFARHVIATITRSPDLKLVWLDPPAMRSGRTVADIAKAGNAQDHCERVRGWANSVWTAWSPHHAAIRRLTDAAIERM